MKIVSSIKNSNNQNSIIDKESSVLDSLISVTYAGKEKKDYTYNKQQNFSTVMKYYSKQFKEAEVLIFDSYISGQLFYNDNRVNVNEVSHDVSQIDNDNSNIYTNNRTEQQTHKSLFIKSNEELCKQFQLFFDQRKINSSNHQQNGQLLITTKSFESNINYSMDLKILIEIKDRVEINKKNNSDSKRLIYFRPEFLFKYIQEINFEQDNSEMSFIRTLKKYMFIEGDNTTPNNQNINQTVRYFKDSHIHFFINCLDTMYFRPFDSYTLSEIFHSYGINMFYLGFISEQTSAPHVRELCLVEMIARVCKKIIFDLMSNKLLEKANEDFYLGQTDPSKFTYELDTNQTPTYLQYVPTAFFIKYHKEYLKKIYIINNEPNIYNEDNHKDRKVLVKGLYKQFWHKYSNYSEKDIRNVFSNKEDKSGKIEKSHEKNTLSEINREVTKFFNVLFNFEGEKYEVDYLGIKYKNISLWKLIYERVKIYYNIENKELLDSYDPIYLSLPALFSSIQFHTGISVTISIINNVKFSNKDLINRDFSEDQITDIKPKVSCYNFRTFNINKDQAECSRNSFSLVYNEELHKKVFIQYFKEKIIKISPVLHTKSMLLYKNLLRKISKVSNDKFVEDILKYDTEYKDKFKDITVFDYLKRKLNFIF